jgi:hypothetical protein
MIEQKEGPMGLEREDAVRALLKELDPLLGLVWLPFARYSPDGRPEGRYALTCRWPQQDMRWELYHSGEIGEPFDILGMFETQGDGMAWFGSGSDQQNAAIEPDAVMDRTIELLGKMDNTRFPWRDKLRKNSEHNLALRRKRQQEVVDEAVDGMKDRRRQLQKVPYVGVVADLE